MIIRWQIYKKNPNILNKNENILFENEIRFFFDFFEL